MFVFQRLADLVQEDLPVPTPDGESIETRTVYTVIGAYPSRHGVGLLGRYADEPVVDVTRSGGVLPMMVGFNWTRRRRGEAPCTVRRAPCTVLSSQILEVVRRRLCPKTA